MTAADYLPVVLRLEVESDEDSIRMLLDFIKCSPFEVRVASVARPRRAVDSDLLSQVAETYAANLGNAPVRAVAEKFGRSRRTASLWIKRAAEAGLIERMERA